ncbi:hypothetical protein ACWEOO_13545 [Kribbella sp. NPDC004138]
MTRLRVATVWPARFTLPRLLHRTLPAVLRPRRRSRMLRPHLLPTRLLWLLHAPHRRTRLPTLLLTARRLRPRCLGRRLLPARLGPRMRAAGLAARLRGSQVLSAWLLPAQLLCAWCLSAGAWRRRWLLSGRLLVGRRL